MIDLRHGDCLEVMREMPDNSIDLIATDPPYFKVKGEGWDRQWDKPHQFLAWMGELCEQWQRILKPNGSLYVFASPQMRARVELKVGEWFSCLPSITWVKSAGWHAKSSKEQARSFVPQTEAIIFAEHFNADNMAKGEAGYQAKCDELRGFVFEPLRAYLDGERERAGFTKPQVNKALGTQMASHYFSRSQWSLPTEKWYGKMREVFNNSGGDYLRREYEDLRREYEDLRRPFSVTADVPYTDVWTFKTVQAYKGKHPCEKPLEMMEHIVRASSREGATVLDCFMGGGSTGVACRNLGRKFIGIEKDADYFAAAKNRIESTTELF